MNSSLLFSAVKKNCMRAIDCYYGHVLVFYVVRPKMDFTRYRILGQQEREKNDWGSGFGKEGMLECVVSPDVISRSLLGFEST